MTEATNSIITQLNCVLQLHEFNCSRQEFCSSNMFNVFILLCLLYFSQDFILVVRVPSTVHNQDKYIINNNNFCLYYTLDTIIHRIKQQIRK